MKIELIKNTHLGLYYHTSLAGNSFGKLVSFLENEIRNYCLEWWIEMLAGNQEILSGDIIKIEQQGEMAHMRFAELTSYDKPDEDPYIIKKIELIELIREWHKLVEQNVDKIIIEELDGIVRIYSE